MSGHSKWSQIKRQKASTDAKKSKIFTRHARLISLEAKKSNGKISASLAQVIESAKKDNVPKDVIERAIKKATENNTEELESIIYECYGPGGSAIIIETLTQNRNKSAQEIKHILSKNGYTLANPGSALWSFEKIENSWQPKITIELNDDEIKLLETLVTELENNEEVSEVFTNVI